MLLISALYSSYAPFLALINWIEKQTLKPEFFLRKERNFRRIPWRNFSMAQRRRTDITWHFIDCFAAERRYSGVIIFRQVSGNNADMFLPEMGFRRKSRGFRFLVKHLVWSRSKVRLWTWAWLWVSEQFCMIMFGFWENLKKISLFGKNIKISFGKIYFSKWAFFSPMLRFDCVRCN